MRASFSCNHSWYSSRAAIRVRPHPLKPAKGSPPRMHPCCHLPLCNRRREACPIVVAVVAACRCRLPTLTPRLWLLSSRNFSCSNHSHSCSQCNNNRCLLLSNKVCLKTPQTQVWLHPHSNNYSNSSNNTPLLFQHPTELPPATMPTLPTLAVPGIGAPTTGDDMRTGIFATRIDTTRRVTIPTTPRRDRGIPLTTSRGTTPTAATSGTGHHLDTQQHTTIVPITGTTGRGTPTRDWGIRRDTTMEDNRTGVVDSTPTMTGTTTPTAVGTPTMNIRWTPTTTRGINTHKIPGDCPVVTMTTGIPKAIGTTTRTAKTFQNSTLQTHSTLLLLISTNTTNTIGNGSKRTSCPPLLPTPPSVRKPLLYTEDKSTSRSASLWIHRVRGCLVDTPNKCSTNTLLTMTRPSITIRSMPKGLTSSMMEDTSTKLPGHPSLSPPRPHLPRDRLPSCLPIPTSGLVSDSEDSW